jgi:hypothetical protein
MGKTLPESIEKRIKNSILNVLEIPVKDTKKIFTYIQQKENNLWIHLKVDLNKLELDLHTLVHNAHLRSDEVNSRSNTRDLTYRVPPKYEDEVKELAPLLEDIKANEDEINKVLDKIDDKKVGGNISKAAATDMHSTAAAAAEPPASSKVS